MKKFSELGLIEPILKSIEHNGITVPTEIQEKSIPIILQGKDLVAGSRTGSGKTLAFASAIIQGIRAKEGVQSIVLTPTRELSSQVAESLKTFSMYQRLRIAAIYGGVSLGPQIDELKHADVVVGTPGRVLDHLSRSTLKLNKVKILVIDEADRMLDMGFIDDVKKILSQTPKERQTLLFSATISDEIYNLAKDYMNDPRKIVVESLVDPKKLGQVYYQVQGNMKFSLLVHLLKREPAGLSMVFCNTQRATDYVAKNLMKQGIRALAIHGGLSQARRNKALEIFHHGSVDVLVCTDVAARGLHIENVSSVYNYDIPKESKQYIHRIGRTARAGNEGKAVNILSDRDYENFDRVLSENDIEIPRAETPRVERIFVESMGRFRNNFRPYRRAITYP